LFRKVLSEEPNGHPEEPSSGKFPEQLIPKSFWKNLLPEKLPEQLLPELSEEVVLPESFRKKVLLDEPNIPGPLFPHFFRQRLLP